MGNQKTIRILIAEDDFLVGRSTAALLEKAGYAVVGQAADGREAVEMTQSLRPDVILMDIKMPVMDGIESTRRIYETCPTPVVALTAYDTPEVAERAIAAGAGAYLTKPASPQEMERAISVTIARFDDMMELRRLNASLQAEIAERKRTEEELAHERDLLQALMDNIPDTIYFKDTASRFTRVNKAQAQVLGVNDPQEAIGKTDFDFFAPEHSRDAYEDEQEIVKSGQPLIGKVERIRRADGQFRWVSATKVPMMDEEGRVIGTVGISRDITERVRAEDALRESEEKYRTILENIEDGYYEVDIAGNLTFFNDSLCRLYRYSEDELMGMNNRQYMDDENARKVHQTFNTVYRTGKPARAFDWEVIRKGGSKRFVEASVSLMRDSTGEPVGFRGVVRDVTERRRAEEEIKRRNRELAALNTIATTMIQSALDLDEVLQLTADGVVKGLGCNTGLIFLLDEKEGIFRGSTTSTKAGILGRLNAIVGFPLLQIKIPARSDFNEAVSNLLAGRATIKRDLHELVEPLLSKPVCFAMQRLLDSKSFFTLPLLAKGKTIGGIVASTAEELSEADAVKLMTFANQAAIAIENAQLYEETRQRALEQETLREAALALTTALDRNQVIDRILAQLQQVVPYDSASVQLLRRNQMEIVGGRGFLNLPDLLGITFPAHGDNPNSEVIRTRAPFIVADAPTMHDGFQKDPHRQAAIRSWLGVPMLVGERLVGMIALDKREPGFYTPQHARLAEAFAAQAAVAIENAHLFEEIEKRQVYLEKVLGAAPDAIVTLDAQHLVVEWNPGAEKLFGYSREEAVGQHLDDLVTNPAVFEEAVGFTQGVLSGKALPPTEAVRYRKDGSPVDVIVAGSPILMGDELIGTVAVYTDITERVRMEGTLRAMALLDELTDLYNRRGFSVLAEQQLKMADRTKTRMLLLFADFDGLKRINDTFGHQEGDRALIETADVLEETFRESDIIARIGGDEFVVLAVETNGASAEVLTARLQENLEARNAREGCRYKLSLSTGLARYDPDHPCSIDDLLAQADRAMYAKKRGHHISAQGG
jgi:diguanylate cyclase (GGDEF)-like protein/PAS domain S-box-containing protein